MPENIRRDLPRFRLVVASKAFPQMVSRFETPAYVSAMQAGEERFRGHGSSSIAEGEEPLISP